jgi:predicted nucleotidyltransferase
LAVIFAILHLKVSDFVVNRLIKRLKKEIADDSHRESLAHALRKNACPLRTLFMPFMSKPRGWNAAARTRLYSVLNDSNKYIQALNDRFTNPSGERKN